MKRFLKIKKNCCCSTFFNGANFVLVALLILFIDTLVRRQTLDAYLCVTVLWNEGHTQKYSMFEKLPPCSTEK